MMNEKKLEQYCRPKGIFKCALFERGMDVRDVLNYVMPSLLTRLTVMGFSVSDTPTGCVIMLDNNAGTMYFDYDRWYVCEGNKGVMSYPIGDFRDKYELTDENGWKTDC